MRDKKINLLQIVNGLAIGGAEKKLLELVQHLDRDRFKIKICTIGHSGPLEQEFHDSGYAVSVIPTARAFDLHAMHKLVQLMRKDRIDIVQTTLMYADIVGTIAAKLARIPARISWETVSHGPDDVLRLRWFHRLSYRVAMNYVDKIVAVSDMVRSSIIEYSKIAAEKVVTIHYGVDLSRFNSAPGIDARTKLGIAQDALVIGVVARLEPWKGLSYLLPAAIQIIKKIPSAIFLLVGDGSLKTQLEEKVKTHHMEYNFKFIGFRDDIDMILPAFDIFTLPSVTEGLPNVILEAMACHKPVVATDVGGIPEIVVSEKTGLLVPSRDSLSLQNALMTLLRNKAKRLEMGEMGRKRVEDYYSLQAQVRSFETVYEETHKEKGR